MTFPHRSGAPRRPVLLIILDGVGVNPSKRHNALALGQTPNLDEFFFRNPFTLLDASGVGVGLPPGQMGNSEVGHMTLGSGCALRQDLVLIDDAIADGRFFVQRPLLAAIDKAKLGRGVLHLLGLASEGGVHSHLHHLLALIDLCRSHQVKPWVHLIADGRDTPPKSILSDLGDVEEALRQAKGQVATLSGRYFAMDRDRRWDRTERAWRAIALGKGRKAASARAAVNAAYAAGESDEFIHPSVIAGFSGLAPDEPMVLFNFRKDRPRQIAAALAVEQFSGFDRGTAPLVELTCMMEYDPALGLPWVFEPEHPQTTLNQLVSAAGLKQFHCAETEKFAHVTFFFNGGRHEPEPAEEHRLIPSPTVKTYDLKPEMSAQAVADAAAAAVETGDYGFVVVNFANGDMVGHTGNQAAAVKAVEALDREVGRLIAAAEHNGYSVILTADHGNCDQMVDPETDEPHTQHTIHPVPFGVSDTERWLLAPSGTLADVAPTVLQLLGLEIPAVMSGRSLLVRSLPQAADLRMGAPPLASAS